MCKINIHTSILLLFLLSSPALAQNYYSSYHVENIDDTIIAQKISASIYNNNFIKNNEYFGPYTEGITYIGSIVQPEIHWSPTRNFALSAGWYLRYFYGRQKIETSLPVIRATFNNQKGLKLTIGQIAGNLQHGFVEPIYNTDNYFIKNPEYGVKLEYSKHKLVSEVYMDWEKFILPGDHTQEIITGGALASYSFAKLPSKKGLSLHLQSLIHHFGGQVDESESLLQSRANAAIGAKYLQPVSCRLLNTIQLSSWYIQALELSQTNTIPFETGFALLNGIHFTNQYIQAGTSWFHGEYFFAPMGDYLFQSVSQFNDWYKGEKRDLICSKISFNYSIHKGIQLGIKLESYYDIQRKSNDFSYGLNLLVDRKLFATRN